MVQSLPKWNPSPLLFAFLVLNLSKQNTWSLHEIRFYPFLEKIKTFFISWSLLKNNFLSPNVVGVTINSSLPKHYKSVKVGTSLSILHNIRNLNFLHWRQSKIINFFIYSLSLFILPPFYGFCESSRISTNKSLKITQKPPNILCPAIDMEPSLEVTDLFMMGPIQFKVGFEPPEPRLKYTRPSPWCASR